MRHRQASRIESGASSFVDGNIRLSYRSGKTRVEGADGFPRPEGGNLCFFLMDDCRNRYCGFWLWSGLARETIVPAILRPPQNRLREQVALLVLIKRLVVARQHGIALAPRQHEGHNASRPHQLVLIKVMDVEAGFGEGKGG